jgi:hypothetical protein
MLIPGIRIDSKLQKWQSGLGLIIVEGGNPTILRFGLIVRDLDTIVFPEVLLDDWGHEIGYPALYDWIAEHGDRFPRAEVFGFDLQGKAVQYFLREIDLNASLPCYAYGSDRQSLTGGQLLDSILIPDTEVADQAKIDPPLEITLPLRKARVKWWKIPAEPVQGSPKKE